MSKRNVKWVKKNLCDVLIAFMVFTRVEPKPRRGYEKRAKNKISSNHEKTEKGRSEDIPR